MNKLQIPGFNSEISSLLNDLINTYIKDEQEKKNWFKSIKQFPAVEKKAEWAQRWIKSGNTSYAERVVAIATIQRIFFSGSFAAIFWLKKRGLMPGLTLSNDLISREVGFRTHLACLHFHSLVKKMDKEKVLEIVIEAVDIEC